MHRLPLGAPNEDAYSLQQQHQIRAPQTYTQTQSVESYQPTLPDEWEMPDEWGYPAQAPPQVSNTPRRAQGAIYPSGSATRGASQHHPTVTSTVPICRYPNCRYPATMDERTRELSEYCSGEHMRAALDLGFPVCPACKTCPRRTDSEFCGSPCESWVAQQEQRQQQERQERHQQHRHWQPSTLGSSSMVPNSGPVTWSNAARGSAAPNSGSRYSWQGRYQQ